MPSTLLIVIAAVAGAGVLLAATLAVVVRRPALVARLARFAVVRRIMVWAMKGQIRRTRKRGGLPGGTTDLEIVLAGQTGAEAEAARAMLKRMSPRQRAEVSRRTLGGEGLTALMETAATAGGDGPSPGRAERRRTTGSSAARTAGQRKAVAKRRAARKATRGR
jgi:hypothetical protein